MRYYRFQIVLFSDGGWFWLPSCWCPPKTNELIVIDRCSAIISFGQTTNKLVLKISCLKMLIKFFIYFTSKIYNIQNLVRE